MSARTSPKVESWMQITVTTNTHDDTKQRSTYVVVACMHMGPLWLHHHHNVSECWVVSLLLMYMVWSLMARQCGLGVG
jgi:hypothetical protein